MGPGWKSQYSKYKEFFLSAYQTYQKKEEIKMFLEIILSLFTVSFFIFFALKPTIITISQLIETIKTKEKIVSQMDEKILNLEKAKELYTREATRVQLALVAVPDSPSPESFSRQMEALSSQNSVALNGVSVSQVTLKGENTQLEDVDLDPLPEDAKGMAVTLTILASSFSSVPNFLTNLESLRRPIKIDTLSVSSILTEGGGSTLILVLDGRTPYLGEVEEEQK